MTTPHTDVGRAAALLDAARSSTVERLRLLEHDFAGMVESSRDSNADDEHDPEGSTIAFERSQVGALAAHARRQLSEIDAALVRLDEGRYGACERCGEPIPWGRLEARPVARHCIVCA